MKRQIMVEVKPSYEVKVGDIIEIQFGNSVSKFKIVAIPKGQNAKLDEIVEII